MGVNPLWKLLLPTKVFTGTPLDGLDEVIVRTAFTPACCGVVALAVFDQPEEDEPFTAFTRYEYAVAGEHDMSG